MTSIPVPDFANAAKVCFWEISRGQSDRAVLARHYKSAPPKGKKPGYVASGLAKGNIPLVSGNGQVAAAMPTELSIKADAGTNLYLISIDPNSQTRFGPSRYPIQLVPLEYTDVILKDVGLIYVDGAGSERFVAAADIPANYGNIPATAMLAFTLDRTALEAAWKLAVTNSGHTDYALKVPFVLNLYDTASGRPVWAYGAPSQPGGPTSGTGTITHSARSAKSGKSAKAQGGTSSGGGVIVNPMIHGGVHPGSPSQFLY